MFRGWQILSIVALVYALGNRPYDYYTLLRFLVCGVTAYGAMASRRREMRSWVCAYSVVAVLYNPIFKIHLQRDTWELINLLTIVFFVVALLRLRTPTSKGLETVADGGSQ